MNTDQTVLIPEAAYEAGETALQGWPIAESDMPDAASDVLHAAVPLIVAAELRRLADELETCAREYREEDGRSIRSAALGVGVRRLRERAAELTGGSDAAAAG